MTPRRITWGRIQLEIGEDRIWFRMAGSPWTDALLFGLLGIGIWCILCVPPLVMKAKVHPSLYIIFGIAALVMFGIGAFSGKRAKETGFIVSLKPSPNLSLMQGGEAIVLPAEELLRFVTREREDTAGDNRVTYYSLVAETRRGEFVILHEMVCNKKAADTFGRLLTSLLLQQLRFDVAVRHLLEVRRRDYVRLGVIMGILVVVLILSLIFCIRRI